MRNNILLKIIIAIGYFLWGIALIFVGYKIFQSNLLGFKKFVSIILFIIGVYLWLRTMIMAIAHYKKIY